MPHNYLPTVPIGGGTQQPWPWTRHGFAAPRESNVSMDVLKATGAWWYDWSWHCADNQVPMVWRYIDYRIWGGNDGRPVLVLNEPERTEQANLTPSQAAAVLVNIFAHWNGEVWGIGTLAHELAYCDAVCAAYEQLCGEPLRLTGWAVHVYNNRANWTVDINDTMYVGAALADLDAFIEHQRSLGRLGRGVIVTEYGALSADYWHSIEDMVPMFEAYEAGFRARPGVLSWAPFSAYYTSFNSTDLLHSDGTPTALGELWIGYATA